MNPLLVLAGTYTGGFIATTLHMHRNRENWGYSMFIGAIWPFYLLAVIMEAMGAL